MSETPSELSAADSGPAAKLGRMAKALFEDRPDLERTVIYVFEPSDDAVESMNRIGGRPFGIDPEFWPSKGDDPEQPMQHMITLDLDTTPLLREHFSEGLKAVSLFVHRPDNNEAWSPYNSGVRVEIVPRRCCDEFEGELPAGEPGAVGFSVTEVEVPLAAWSVEYDDSDPELEAIKTAIYQLGAWTGKGGPIWLQDDEHDGMFVMQFDESFVHMNLGDTGIMYVFYDTAFWQCH